MLILISGWTKDIFGKTDMIRLELDNAIENSYVRGFGTLLGREDTDGIFAFVGFNISKKWVSMGDKDMAEIW